MPRINPSGRTPSWLPRPLRLHGVAVEHARLADSEVGDVDHILHFALAFGLDLAGLEGDQAAQRILVAAQFMPDAPHQLTALRCGHFAPVLEGGDRGRHHLLVVIVGAASDLGDRLSCRWIERGEGTLARKPLAGEGTGIFEAYSKFAYDIHDGSSPSASLRDTGYVIDGTWSI